MLRLIFLAPFLLVLIVFALSNTAATTLGFWPTALAVVTPLSVAVLVAAALFFLLGALVTWFGTLAQARRARRAEARVRLLEGQIETLRPRPVAGMLPGDPHAPLEWDALPPAA